jgi:hypothetical protein
MQALSHRRRPLQAASRRATLKRVDADIKRMRKTLNELKDNSSRLLFWMQTYSPGGISPERIEQFRKHKIKRLSTQQRINYTRRRALK